MLSNKIFKKCLRESSFFAFKFDVNAFNYILLFIFYMKLKFKLKENILPDMNFLKSHFHSINY